MMLKRTLVVNTISVIFFGVTAVVAYFVAAPTTIRSRTNRLQLLQQPADLHRMIHPFPPPPLTVQRMELKDNNTNNTNQDRPSVRDRLRQALEQRDANLQLGGVGGASSSISSSSSLSEKKQQQQQQQQKGQDFNDNDNNTSNVLIAAELKQVLERLGETAAAAAAAAAKTSSSSSSSYPATPPHHAHHRTTTTTAMPINPAAAYSYKLQHLILQDNNNNDDDVFAAATTTSSLPKVLPLQPQQHSMPAAAVLQQREQQQHNMPVPNKQGIYQIESEPQYAALLRANPDKLVVIKFKANYCRACKAVEPKFIAVKNATQKGIATTTTSTSTMMMMTADLSLPIVWAEISSSPQNKDFFRRVGVLTLPTIHFYDGSNGLTENFPCGPKSFGLLSQKLALFLDRRVDPVTLQLKALEVVGTTAAAADGSGATTLSSKAAAAAANGAATAVPVLSSDEPRRVRSVFVENELISNEHLKYLRYGMPFFRDLTDEEFSVMMSKARLLTFNEGDIIVRQGMPPKTFFVIKSGEVEMCIRSRFEDPISTPPSYLGAVVNRLKKFDYLGERAATTGEPFAASFRVVKKTRCFAFNVEDIPESSILSKKRRATQAMVEELSARYELPEDYKPPYPVTEQDQCILELLVRFKQIRQAAKCFEYVLSAHPLLNDEGEIARRSVLVSKLSNSQRQDFVEVFNLVDTTKSGTISLLEMRRFMESAREEKTDEEILSMIRKANPLANNSQFGTGLTLNEFLGVMAEAEFYSLFTEMFKELDKENTGYVRAGDLDQILGGVRDLIGDRKQSIIDVEDQDIHVDYEQFAKMLLGAAL